MSQRESHASDTRNGLSRRYAPGPSLVDLEGGTTDSGGRGTQAPGSWRPGDFGEGLPRRTEGWREQYGGPSVLVNSGADGDEMTRDFDNGRAEHRLHTQNPGKKVGVFVPTGD